MKYACIQRHRGEFPLGLMCRVLAVSRSGYYAWRAGRRVAGPTPTSSEHGDPSGARGESAHLWQSPGASRAGDPRRRCGRHRVARLMRAAGLRATVAGAGADHRQPPWDPVATNTLARQFAAARLDQVWAADLTYVPTDEGRLYLAVVLDLASRRVVGWAMAARLTHAGPRGPGDGVRHRRPAGGLLHHSDRGSQYASADYQARLAQHGLQVSMSRPGDVWDNAMAESFFATLKTELVHQRHFRTRQEARAELFEYIEIWYNRRRRHSALGYLSPAVYEQQQVA